MNSITTQINALPNKYIFFTQKEIRALPKHLGADERILALTSGMMEHRTWLALCTTERVIFINSGMIYGERLMQIPITRIQSIDHEFGLLFGYIRVWDGASYFNMRWVLRSSIEPFVRAVQGAMDAARNVTTHASGPVDIATQLEKLADLRDRGALTNEEFSAQKKKLLNG